jgi:hypothetical protein
MTLNITENSAICAVVILRMSALVISCGSEKTHSQLIDLGGGADRAALLVRIVLADSAPPHAASMR